MTTGRRCLVLAVCMTALVVDASAQNAAGGPSVVLTQIEVYYPIIAMQARVSGQLDVRVGVRPDGSVADVTVFPQADARWKELFYVTVVNATARATFACRGCTQPSTSHMLTFVFVLDGIDSAGNLLPASWKQTSDARSEVTVFGRVPVIGPGPASTPFHTRAARCLWLWHCSEHAYVIPRM